MRHLNTLLEQATQEGTIPGAVICVGHQGSLVWHQAYGAAALTPSPRPMQPDTLFDLASLTKAIATTSLVLWAQHDGLCQLDDRLHSFFPHLASAPMDTLTIRHLLTHTAGVAAYYPVYKDLLPAGAIIPDTTTATQLRRQATHIICQQPLVYTPETDVIYSDLGFILLGHLLEQLYAQPLSTLFIEKVAKPLGLAHMAYRPFGSATPLPDVPEAYAATESCMWRGRVLAGEVHDENAWAMGGIAGHAGLFSTALDVWGFAQSLLDTVTGNCTWLPPELIQNSWQRHGRPSKSTRALGWDTPTAGRSTSGDYFSPRSIGHLGFTGTSLWIDLEQDVIVVLCTNRIHPTRQSTGIQSLRPAVHNLVMQGLGIMIKPGVPKK